jgi:hypothetical protein
MLKRASLLEREVTNDAAAVCIFHLPAEQVHIRGGKRNRKILD